MVCQSSMVRLGTRRRQRAFRESALLLALLLPALVCGPVFGGRTVWLHSHGDEEVHVHLPPAGSAGGLALGEWHDSQHHDESDEHHEHGQVPAGVVVHLPRVLVASSQAARALPSLGAFHIAAWSVTILRVDAGRRPCRPELFRSGWPPQSGQRTGVAELLRSSHAILI